MSEKTKELDTRIDAYSATLLDKLRAGATDEYKRFLEFASRFHRYSLGNQVLIWMVNPDATFVAGFKTWLKMGNPVRKGEHGMKILVPFRGVREVTDPVTGTTTERPYLTFGPGTVFDISQTQNPDFAPPGLNLTVGLGTDKSDLVPVILSAIEADGIEVGVRDELPLAVSMGGRIEYQDTVDANNLVGNLLHEWDHEIRRRDSTWYSENSRGLGECYAEGAAYIASLHFGVERPFSSDYIIRWGTEAETFRSVMSEINKDVKYMIERIEVAQKNQDAAVVAAEVVISDPAMLRDAIQHTKELEESVA